MLNVGQQLGICILSHCYPPPKGYAAILNRNFNLRQCIEIARRTVESLSKLHELDIAQKDLSLADIYIRPSKVSITRISNQPYLWHSNVICRISGKNKNCAVVLKILSVG